jgi:hypothetical protein
MSDSLGPALLLFGASTASGAALLEQAAGRRVLVAGRRRPTGWPEEHFLPCDLETIPPRLDLTGLLPPPPELANPEMPAAYVLVSFAPIWTLAPFLERMLEAQASPAAIAPNPAAGRLAAVVACSSSSVLTKRFAANRADQELVERLSQAESRVEGSARAAGIPCHILRPTLIYGQAGAYGDQNLSRLIQWMARVPLLPIPARSGLRQPIHARQLAAVALHLADHPGAAESPLAIGGDEGLSYGTMLRRLQAAVLRDHPQHPAGRCRLLPLPNRLFHLLAAPLLPISERGFEAVQRIEANLGPFLPAHRLLGRDPEPFPAAPLALGSGNRAGVPSARKTP